MLLVPGDCPLLDPDELDALLGRRIARRAALIVPDRHGTGTNALLLHAARRLEPAFGPGSCERHPQRGGDGRHPGEIVEVPVAGARRRHAGGPAARSSRRSPTTRGGAAHTRGMLRS